MRVSRVAPLLVVAAALLGLSPATLAAQESAGVDHRPPPECFRFAFGTWTPPLDWSAAGHRGQPEADAGAQGRGNAAHTERGGEGPLLLFPAFWPAGVLIRFDPATRGDTLRGTATALVADAARTPPVAPITALRVACTPGR